jgi:hypothetical protein
VEGQYRRISGPLAFGLVCLALCFDGVQILLSLTVVGLLISPLISLLATFTFWLMLTHNDVPIGDRYVGRFLLK